MEFSRSREFQPWTLIWRFASADISNRFLQFFFFWIFFFFFKHCHVYRLPIFVVNGWLQLRKLFNGTEIIIIIISRHATGDPKIGIYLKPHWIEFEGTKTVQILDRIWIRPGSHFPSNGIIQRISKRNV